MKTQDFDDAFEAGGDMTPHLDMTTLRKLKQDHKHVNVAFPAWMVQGLDREATRIGITRQSLIKLWIAEKLG